MGVYIKGMEMPKDCGSCDLCDNDGYCYALYGDSLWDALPDGAEYFPDGWKYVGCPLVEIPTPHGDLIDRDALDARVRQAGGMGNVEEECTEDFNDGVLFVLDYFVKNAPTIIEAKGSEDG